MYLLTFFQNYILFNILLLSLMSNRKSKKLWKDIGITKQKFDRDSERSPSFDRSSLARSNQGRSQSSHSVRLSKRKQDIQKTQIRNQIDQATKNFVSTNLHDIDLVAVPQQQDVHNSHISFKHAAQNYEAGEDQVELDLLKQLFSKSNKIKKGKKLKKQDFPVLKESVKNLSMYHMQVSKYVKFSLNNFKNQIYKMDRKFKEIISKMTKQLFLKTNQIAKLTLQNNELKKQLMNALDMIQELRNINSTNVSPSRLLKSRKSFDIIENDINSRTQQNEDISVNYPNYKRNEQQNNLDYQYNFRSGGFSYIKEPKIKTTGSIAQSNIIKRLEQSQQSQVNKRQKFKKFINQRHQKKNEVKKQLERQNKFDSLTDNGVASMKYYRKSGGSIVDENLVGKNFKEKNPFSLQPGGVVEQKFWRSSVQSQNQFQRNERLNSQKGIYPIERSKKSNNR